MKYNFLKTKKKSNKDNYKIVYKRQKTNCRFCVKLSKKIYFF